MIVFKNKKVKLNGIEIQKRTARNHIRMGMKLLLLSAEKLLLPRSKT